MRSNEKLSNFLESLVLFLSSEISYITKVNMSLFLIKVNMVFVFCILHRWESKSNWMNLLSTKILSSVRNILAFEMTEGKTYILLILNTKKRKTHLRRNIVVILCRIFRQEVTNGL